MSRCRVVGSRGAIRIGVALMYSRIHPRARRSRPVSFLPCPAARLYIGHKYARAPASKTADDAHDSLPASSRAAWGIRDSVCRASRMSFFHKAALSGGMENSRGGGDALPPMTRARAPVTMQSFDCVVRLRELCPYPMM